MTNILISMPDQLASRMKSIIPPRQRSKVIANLIEGELNKRQQILYECALAVENDNVLHQEISEWDVTLQDGLENESW
jgi:hypothetical protein